MSVNSARNAISKVLLRPVSGRTVRVAPQSARHLSLLASTRISPAAHFTPTVPKALAVSGVRFKSLDKAWGPNIVSYEELKPITEQPTDVSRLVLYLVSSSLADSMSTRHQDVLIVGM